MTAGIDAKAFVFFTLYPSPSTKSKTSDTPFANVNEKFSAATVACNVPV